MPLRIPAFFWRFPAHLALRRIQTIAVISVIAIVLIAFRIGILRGFDHTIGIEEYGRLEFAIGGAVTDQVFGVSGYVIGRHVEEILITNGLTADESVLAKLGVRFPDNLRNPVLVERAIDRAVGFVYGAGPARGASGDDPGMIDYVKLSFALFGRSLLSLFLTYFVLLATEVGCFFLAFRRRPSDLAFLAVTLIAQVCVLSSALLDFSTMAEFTAFGTGLGSVSNPRFLSVLAILPALHAALLVLRREPLSPGGVLLLSIQALVAALGIWIRASAAWVVIALCALSLGVLFSTLCGRRSGDWRAGVARLWPVLAFFIVVGGHDAYVKNSLSPVYHQQNDLSHHALWHSILFSMQFNPDLIKRFKSLVGDKVDDQMTTVASERYLQRHPEAVEPADYVDGHLTLSAIEKYSRAVFFEILHQDPGFVLVTYLYYKPYTLLRGLVAFVVSLHRLSILGMASMLLPVGILIIMVAKWSEERRHLFNVACAISTGFLISTIPVLVTVPFPQTIADQFFGLLIALGAWMMCAVMALSALCRSALATRGFILAYPAAVR